MFENNYVFDYDYDYLYYDIEAVAQNKDFPNKHNNTAFVTSIQFYHNNITYVYTLSIYEQQFTQQSNVIYVYFDDSATMCQQFIMYLHWLTWYTLVIGFNSSSEVFSKEEYPQHNEFYGYDLGFIVHQSGFRNLQPCNGKGMNAIQTTNIYELPNVLFIDLFVLLKQQVESVAEIKQSMDGLTLNDFCKLFKTQTKHDMDHEQAWLLLLREWQHFNNYSELLTQFFDYAIQDINVLIQLVNNSHVIDDNITLCWELWCSLWMLC